MSATTPSEPTAGTGTDAAVETPGGSWRGAAGAGILAGVAMGAVMAALAPETVTVAIPGLYGQDGALVGVVAHLAHSALFGLLFAAALRLGTLSRYAERVAPSTALGVAYGLILWIVAASVVMPAWMSAMGMAATVPTFDALSLSAHVVYGAVLGALFPYAGSTKTD